MKPRPQHIPAMSTIDVRFNAKDAMKLVRRDLRQMRKIDPVMYWSMIGAMFFLALDVLTMAFVVIYISII
jgi:hypothetical protein